jgi:Ca-activated chloride channel family protein
MRRYLNDGSLPPPESVRVEEYVNYFDLNYPTPPDVSFGIYADGAPSPYHTDGAIILRIGVQGYQIPAWERKPAALTFVIDISGSMKRENRLEMVKRALNMLVDQLNEDDTVAIVVYGSDARVLLNPTRGSNRDTILNAIYSLNPEGSTNAAAGLRLGYDLAMEAYKPRMTNRVILCSDGVANVGDTEAQSILDHVYSYVDEGVYLTTVGFGMGNFNDVLMEQLADKGNGNYSYVDTMEQAERIFVEQLTSTLEVIALDAKAQVDFNPDVTAYYRLVGYENRDVADTDFRDDTVDAGELGAGHSVTALYEIMLRPGAEGRLATVQLRWTDPQSYETSEINGNINTWDLSASFEQTDPYYKLAVAVMGYAEILRDSPWMKNISLEQVYRIALPLARSIPEDDDVAEFIQLLDQARRMGR